MSDRPVDWPCAYCGDETHARSRCDLEIEHEQHYLEALAEREHATAVAVLARMIEGDHLDDRCDGLFDRQDAQAESRADHEAMR